MKKAIAILLVLLVAGVAFGADTFSGYTNDGSASLELQTVVAGRYGVKVTSDAVTGGTLGALITAFINANEVSTPIVFTENAPTETLYINYMTNQKIQAIVDVTATPLESDDEEITTKIGYTVTVDLTDTEVTSSSTGTEITFFDESSETNGMRVQSKAFTIAMNTDDFLAATAAADYETTWTIALTTL